MEKKIRKSSLPLAGRIFLKKKAASCFDLAAIMK
jgi:hypothetical protein